MKIKKGIAFFIGLACLLQVSFAQDFFSVDTFTYTINLDLSQNLYLKSVPEDLLKGFCQGNWNAYYPKKEMNQCLFDDFLQRFNYYQLDIPADADFCADDYCKDPYFLDMYKQFTRKLKFREILYFDQQHSVVKREVLWLQLYYSRMEFDGWKHYNGPVFWMKEINGADNGIMVRNKSIRPDPWSLLMEFEHAGFLVNENTQKDTQQKLDKYGSAEEN
jgi:hypothetical protein